MELPVNAQVVVPEMVHLVPGWVAQPDELLVQLSAELAGLLQPFVGFRGRQDPDRHTARLGDPGVTYVYGDRVHPLAPLTPGLASLRDQLVVALGVPFNVCYVNRYANGTGIPRHSDAAKLPQLGVTPVIAAVSLGEARTFQLWDAAHPRKRDLMRSAVLPHGSLCIMHGLSQQALLHGIPKETALGIRLSLTFRHHGASP